MAVWFMERDLVPDLTYQTMKKESSLTFYWNVQKLDTEKQVETLNVLWSLTFKPDLSNGGCALEPRPPKVIAKN